MPNFTMETVQELVLLSLRELLPSLRRFSEPQLFKKLGKEKLEDAVGQVVDFIESGCGDLSRNEYLALITQSLRCLSNYLQLAGAPVTANTLINSIHLMPHAVDKAFPSYAQSGLLRCIVSPGMMKQERGRVQLLSTG